MNQAQVTPRVSVVIPTSGRAELVVRAASSVLAQTMADLELIVVIDGQDPATEGVLSELSDSRLRIIVHHRQLGPGEARNTGADASLGPWIAFLDDDDEWCAQKLERQLAVAPPEPAIMMSLSKVATPLGTYVWPGEIYDNIMPIDEYLFDRRTWLKGGESFCQTSSLLVPSELFRKLHFTHDRQHEDWEFVIRAVKEFRYPLLTVPEPLVIHFVDDNRPSLSNSSVWKTSLNWIDALGSLVTPRAYSGFCCTTIAPIAARRGDYSAIAVLLSRAFRRGSPTTRQLAAFFAFWALPPRLRGHLRALMQSSR